jgi:hypothetical protein
MEKDIFLLDVLVEKLYNFTWQHFTHRGMGSLMKNVEAYKTIKVPLWVYENAKEVELTLLRKGFSHLPADVLQPQRCPICNFELQVIKGRNEYLHCDHCGYTQQLFQPSGAAEGVVLGTAIGMGLVYFINQLFKRTNGER